MVLQEQERSVQNVCTPFPLLQKSHIFYIFQLATPINGLTVTGMMYTECVYTVPVATKNQIFYIFQLATPINGLTVTGTVYTECVYTFPVATIEPYFLYFSVSHSN